MLNRPVVKNILLGLSVIIIGGICSALGTWDFKNDKYIFLKLFALVIFLVGYVALLAYYATKEVNTNRVIGELQKQNKAFEDAMVGIISICEQSSKNINTIIHEVIDEGKINLHIWSFDIGCRLICEKIYNLLCNLHGSSKDFGISYVRLVEEGDQDEVYMNAYFNQNMSEPSIHKKRRKIQNKAGYHDLELFQKNKSDIEIVLGNEKIRELFSWETNESRRRSSKKYNQFIAIPVFCSKEDGGKMVGLLEIVCLNDTELAKTEEEIKEIVSKYFVPYAYLLLLLHKLEKAILAQPKRERGQINE